jgi:alpha-tubulin suppressor-like RCC1 family protein
MTYDHACALRASGEVACWGLDNFGQLGDRATTSRSTPVAVQGLGPVTQVAAGGVHTCALEASGEILCWGVNGNGQLGDGTVEGTRPAPTKVVGITDAVEIGAGSRFTCARRANGQVLCWGQGCENQLGNGRCESEPRPRVVDGLPPAAELRVGAGTACIRSGSGEVRCWGRSGLPEPLPADVQEVAPGAYHACALTRSGDVLCWGFRGYLGGVRHLGLWSIQPPST